MFHIGSIVPLCVCVHVCVHVCVCVCVCGVCVWCVCVCVCVCVTPIRNEMMLNGVILPVGLNQVFSPQTERSFVGAARFVAAAATVQRVHVVLGVTVLGLRGSRREDHLLLSHTT